MSLGNPIDATDANTILTQHDLLKTTSDSIINRELKRHEAFFRRFEGNPAEVFKNFYNKVLQHFADYENAYVFSKDRVMACFKSGAPYLMVLVASQKKTDLPLIEGMETTIIAGCREVSSGKFETVDKTPLGYEHPPKIYKKEVPTFKAAIKSHLMDIIQKIESNNDPDKLEEIENSLKLLLANDAFVTNEKIIISEQVSK
jgi:hypothetical protein